MIFIYNENIGDVLLVITAQAKSKKIDYERRENISRIFKAETKETVGWNFFNISTFIPNLKKQDNGQIFLTDKEVHLLNEQLEKANFKERISNDTKPKFIVGLIKELEKHPNSDHLKIAQVEVDDGEVLQIVAGAPNIELGQTVVVAKVGAMMPDGTIIWPGNLRGINSEGMLSSPRELHLPNAPLHRGILILPAQTPIGVPFNPGKHWQK